MRATEEFWADKVIARAYSLAKRVGSCPTRGLMWKTNGKLAVDVMGMHDFLLKVEGVVDEYEELKNSQSRAENPDQLTLF